MMRLPPFRYLAPRSAAEAARILADHGPEAMAVAGGTDLYPNMKRRQFTPSVLVSLRGLPDAGRISANGGLTLGAMATLTDVAHWERGSVITIAASRLLVGGIPESMISCCCVDIQLSFCMIRFPFASCNSSTGSGSGALIPAAASEGPSARTMTLVDSNPPTMNPPIVSLSPAPASARVEMLLRREPLASTS